jgi:hypothetical protein
VLDVFEIDATEGELLKIVLSTVGADPAGNVGAGQADIDVYLFSELPTSVQPVEGGVVPNGGTVASTDGATFSATERILYEVPTTGTYYAVVILFAGPEGDYNLIFDRSFACTQDSDCAGTDFCRVDVDPLFVTVLQQCDTWTTPTCGQGTEEGGGDIHSDTDATALAGPVTGDMCGTDIDVFTFEKAIGETALIKASSTDLGADDFLIVTVVDPEGTSNFVAINADQGEGTQTVSGVGRAGTYHVYIDQFGLPDSTTTSTYTLDVTITDTCRTDADCSGGQVCGQSIGGSGYFAICADPAPTACGETDDDNGRSTGTLLTSGTAVSATSCMDALDHYRVQLPADVNDVEIDLTWTTGEDLDVYVYDADGTYLGAGWYGDGAENWEGSSLPAGELVLVVDVFSCADGPCDTPVDYSITATLTSGTQCSTDDQCIVGGTTGFPNQGLFDPGRQLRCVPRATGGGGGTDAGPQDAGTDAGYDGGYDAGYDGGYDGGYDAGYDAGTDAGSTDAGSTDAGADSGTDSGVVDSGYDGGYDGGYDAGYDGGYDAGYDAGTTATDAGTSTDAGTGDTVMVCARNVPAANFDSATGDECFEAQDCAGVLCLQDYCSQECTADTDCSAIGAGSYCWDLTLPGICLSACTDTADCQEVFGDDTTLQCFQGECAAPN